MCAACQDDMVISVKWVWLHGTAQLCGEFPSLGASIVEWSEEHGWLWLHRQKWV